MSMRDELLPLIKDLRSESGADFELALRTISTLLSNILEHPEAERFRTVRLSNTAFHLRVGRFASSLSLLRCLGFEEAVGAASPTTDNATAERQFTTDNAASERQCTHLAMPTADAPLLAEGLVLLEASAQAAALVREQSCGGDSASASSQRSAATGKRSLEAQPRSNAEGKRRAVDGGPPSAAAPPSTGCTSAGGEAEAETLTLREYTASAIDAFFATLIGADAERLPEASAEGFRQLAAAASDAEAVTRGTGDRAAGARAAHWRSRIMQHGELCGWAEPAAVGGDTAAAGAAASAPELEGGGGSAANGGCSVHCAEAAQGGGASWSEAGGCRGEASSSEAAAAEGGGTGEAGGWGDAMGFVDEEWMGEDGNLETCHVCGEGGLLVCCEACPEAYHVHCLPAEARPPPDDNDESAWFCPVCQEAMARNER